MDLYNKTAIITGTINIYQQLLPYRIIKQLTYLYITSTAPLQQNHLSPLTYLYITRYLYNKNYQQVPYNYRIKDNKTSQEQFENTRWLRDKNISTALIHI